MSNKPKILVTGGNGFIGSHLLEVLLEDGELAKNIRLIIPKKEKIQGSLKRFEIIQGSITDKQVVEKAVKGVNTIYHLAALTIDGGKYYLESEYQDVNVYGTKVILDACKKQRIKKFVFFSSIAVYGLPAWVGNIENWNETQQISPTEIYGQSKYDAEKLIIEAHHKWGLPYAIIRPTSVYGPRDKRNLLELYKAIKKHLFFFVGNGNNLMDYIYAKDIAYAARLAEKSSYKNEDYIIGAGTPITLKEVAKCVATSINYPVPNIYIPKIIAFLISYPVMWFSQILNAKPMLFPKRVEVLTTNCYYDISKARKKLKFEPKTSFEKGTKLTAEWLKKTNKI